jgi:hypothetical protein
MSDTAAEKKTNRNSERYNCPSFFFVRIRSDGKPEERAPVADLSLRGLKVVTTVDFEQGAAADIKLISSYTAPVKLRTRIAWIRSLEDEEASYMVGFSIFKIRIVDWFKFLRIVSQIKKELW